LRSARHLSTGQHGDGRSGHSSPTHPASRAPSAVPSTCRGTGPLTRGQEALPRSSTTSVATPRGGILVVSPCIAITAKPPFASWTRYPPKAPARQSPRWSVRATAHMSSAKRAGSTFVGSVDASASYAFQEPHTARC
jgi:hypothetical protein